MGAKLKTSDMKVLFLYQSHLQFIVELPSLLIQEGELINPIRTNKRLGSNYHPNQLPTILCLLPKSKCIYRERTRERTRQKERRRRENKGKHVFSGRLSIYRVF